MAAVALILLAVVVVMGVAVEGWVLPPAPVLVPVPAPVRKLTLALVVVVGTVGAVVVVVALALVVVVMVEVAVKVGTVGTVGTVVVKVVMVVVVLPRTTMTWWSVLTLPAWQCRMPGCMTVPAQARHMTKQAQAQPRSAGVTKAPPCAATAPALAALTRTATWRRCWQGGRT